MKEQNKFRLKQVGRVILLATIFVMVMLFFAGNVNAASAVYQNTKTDEHQLPKEKVGKYYIWTEDNSEAGTKATSCLYLSKDGAHKKVLKRFTARNQMIESNIISNGKTIYYCVYDSKNEKSTIYRTTDKGQQHVKMKSVSNHVSLAAYYNGAIYYSKKQDSDKTSKAYRYDLYKYNVKSRKTVRVRKQFFGDSQYGKYLTGGPAGSADKNRSRMSVLNLDTGKIRALPDARESTVTASAIYFWKITDSSKMKIGLYRCSRSGKKVTKINEFSAYSPETIPNLSYLGRESSWIIGARKNPVQYLYHSRTVVEHFQDKVQVGNVCLNHGTYKSVNFPGATIWMNSDGSCKYVFPEKDFDSFIAVNATGTWRISEMENYGIYEPVVIFELSNGRSEVYIIRNDDMFASDWIQFRWQK